MKATRSREGLSARGTVRRYPIRGIFAWASATRGTSARNMPPAMNVRRFTAPRDKALVTRDPGPTAPRLKAADVCKPGNHRLTGSCAALRRVPRSASASAAWRRSFVSSDGEASPTESTSWEVRKRAANRRSCRLSRMGTVIPMTARLAADTTKQARDEGWARRRDAGVAHAAFLIRSLLDVRLLPRADAHTVPPRR